MEDINTELSIPEPDFALSREAYSVSERGGAVPGAALPFFADSDWFAILPVRVARAVPGTHHVHSFSFFACLLKLGSHQSTHDGVAA
jgi:hypothetical protein